MPPTQGPLARSPTGSWVIAASPPSLVTSPASGPNYPATGTRVVSPTPDGRPARQDKKRLSLAFFKGGNTSEPQEQRKPASEQTEERDSSSHAPSSRSRSKENSKNRLSWLNPAPTTEPMPPPIKSQTPSQQNSSYSGTPRSQSVDTRPDTSKSGRSEEQGVAAKIGSVRKRLSILQIGKKSSKSSVKSRLGETLAEE